jgi:DNA-binding transcriptional LysR family regulator
MLNLQRLAVFREVARSGSFSAAAERLDYSQPAISHHVAKLELEVGAALFVRMHRGLKLTDAGREVLRHADALLDLAGDAEAELRAVVRETPDCVRLGGFQTSTEAVMATALEGFWARFPQTRVTLLEADPIDHLEGLRAGQLDLALVFDHPEGSITDDPRLIVRYVHEDPMLLVLPEGHAIASGEAVPLGALSNARWLEGAGPEATSSVFLARACERLGFRPDIAFACGNYYAVQGLVARGMGIALIPELATRHRVDGVVLRRPSDGEPARRIGVARLRARNVAPHVAAMEAAIADAFELYAADRATASISTA